MPESPLISVISARARHLWWLLAACSSPYYPGTPSHIVMEPRQLPSLAMISFPPRSQLQPNAVSADNKILGQWRLYNFFASNCR